MTIDLFKNLNKPDAELHPQFLALRDAVQFSSARGIIQELQTDFIDPDGNFVEQFQTTGFDARTFEFFLFAMFLESNHDVNRKQNRPDFIIAKDGIEVAIEAVTASIPSNKGLQPYFAIPPDLTAQQNIDYARNSIPIRLGSPLFTKLQQRYWLEPHVAGKPFVIAIEDFHMPGSLSTPSTVLSAYLYGLEHNWYHDEEGKLIITEKAILHHLAGAKKIPSGFFYQPEAENVSAVLFCNSGTIPKFARMGHEGDYRHRSVRMVRHGVCYQHNPNATRPNIFVYEVGDKRMGKESWREGTILIKNPNALYPVPEGWLGASMEESVVDGKQISLTKDSFLPYFSMTNIYGKYPTNRMIGGTMSDIQKILTKALSAN